VTLTSSRRASVAAVTLAVGEMHVELRKGWQEFALTCGTPHDVLVVPPPAFLTRESKSKLH
jgi:hypothetical protein